MWNAGKISCDRVWDLASKIQNARGLPLVFKCAIPKTKEHTSGKKWSPN